MTEYVDLSERVTATFYSDEYEEWTQQTVTIADVLDSVCEDYTVLPSAQSEIIRCKDCQHWRQQTDHQGVPLPFGFCESDAMWRSLYGETYEVSHIDTDDDHYCGYAERRTDEPNKQTD